MQPPSPSRLNQNQGTQDKFNHDVKKSLASLSFGTPTKPDNMQGFWAIGTSPAINTEFEIKHNLGYIPTGYLVFYQNLAGSFYDSGTAWTSTSIFLKCSTATVKYKLFIQ